DDRIPAAIGSCRCRGDRDALPPASHMRTAFPGQAGPAGLKPADRTRTAQSRRQGKPSGQTPPFSPSLDSQRTGIAPRIALPASPARSRMDRRSQTSHPSNRRQARTPIAAACVIARCRRHRPAPIAPLERMPAMPVPARLLRRITLTALPLLLACPALADTLRPAAPVRAVTLFPSGAEVVRRIALDAPAGRHQVIVTGLPQRLDPATLRISATGGQLASFALQDRRALPDTAPESPAVTEARAALDAARAA